MIKSTTSATAIASIQRFRGHFSAGRAPPCTPLPVYGGRRPRPPDSPYPAGVVGAQEADAAGTPRARPMCRGPLSLGTGGGIAQQGGHGEQGGKRPPANQGGGLDPGRDGLRRGAGRRRAADNQERRLVGVVQKSTLSSTKSRPPVTIYKGPSRWGGKPEPGRHRPEIFVRMMAACSDSSGVKKRIHALVGGKSAHRRWTKFEAPLRCCAWARRLRHDGRVGQGQGAPGRADERAPGQMGQEGGFRSLPEDDSPGR